MGEFRSDCFSFSQNKVDTVQGDSWVNLVIRNLQENDSGEYKCTASSNTNPDLMLDKVIRIKVKALKPETLKRKIHKKRFGFFCNYFF